MTDGERRRRLDNDDPHNYGSKGSGLGRPSIVDSGIHAQTASVQAELLGGQVAEEAFGGGKLEALLVRVVGRERVEEIVRERAERAIRLNLGERLIGAIQPCKTKRGGWIREETEGGVVRRRRSEGYPEQVTFKVSAEQKALLDTLAHAHGMDASALAREILSAGMDVLAAEGRRRVDAGKGGEVVAAAADGGGYYGVRVRRVGGAA